MRFLSSWKWPAMTAAGLLVVAGVLVANKLTIDGSLNDRSRTEFNKSSTTSGEENMSIAHTKSRVQHATEATFATTVLKSNVPVLVDFYADWCGPCQRLAPVLEELAAELPDVKIVKINVEDSPGLTAEYGVSSIPSLKVFKNGQVNEELVGLASKSQLRTILRR